MVTPLPPWTGGTGPPAAPADAGAASPQHTAVTSTRRSISTRYTPEERRRFPNRAGEGNRTPIFGLGSQRLGHWTTPALRGSLSDAVTLATCGCACSGR